MLKLAGSQRYGTQTTGCSATKPLPLEEPGRMDQYRAAVGLPPLRVYIALRQELPEVGRP